MAETTSTTQEPSQEVLDPIHFVPPSPLPHPRIVIEFCDRVRGVYFQVCISDVPIVSLVRVPADMTSTQSQSVDRLHRATWMSTELLLTFPPPALAAISVIPLNSDDTAGRFRVWLEVGDGPPILMWDRKVNGGFPELKALVSRTMPRMDSESYSLLHRSNASATISNLASRSDTLTESREYWARGT